jgi:hypothetical protein
VTVNMQHDRQQLPPIALKPVSTPTTVVDNVSLESGVAYDLPVAEQLYQNVRVRRDAVLRFPCKSGAYS